MLKILISGTKNGFGFSQFANNLDPTDLGEIAHVLTDGRGFIRFNRTGVVYYSIGFSNNYKIYTLAKSCLDVAGTGGYVAISLLIPKDKKISCSIRLLLNDLMYVYFNRYIDYNMRVKPEMENIAFFTAILFQRNIVESDDELGDIMNWDANGKTGIAYYAYSGDNELDEIFAKTYLNPLENYAKVVFMDRRIIENITLYSGQFYSQNPIRIPELTSPTVYSFVPFNSPDGSNLTEFCKYGRNGSKTSIIDSYTNCEFYEFSQISLRISKQSFQPFDTGRFSVRDGLSNNLLYKAGNDKIGIVPQKLLPLQIQIRLHAKSGNVDVTDKVSFAEKKTDGSCNILYDKTIKFSSDNMNGLSTLCVGTDNSYFAAFPPQTYKEIFDSCKSQTGDTMCDYYVDVQEIIYRLDEKSNIGATVTYRISGKSYKVTFDNTTNRVFKMFLPIDFNKNDILIDKPEVGANYKVSDFDEFENKFLFQKPDPIKLVVEVNCNQRIGSKLKLFLNGDENEMLSYNPANDTFSAEIDAKKAGLKTISCTIDGQKSPYRLGEIMLDKKINTKQLSFRSFTFILDENSENGSVDFYYKGIIIAKNVNFAGNKIFPLIIPGEKDDAINNVCVQTNDGRNISYTISRNDYICKITVPKHGTFSYNGNRLNEKSKFKVIFRDYNVIPETGSFVCTQEKQGNQPINIKHRYDEEKNLLTLENAAKDVVINVKCKDKRGNVYQGYAGIGFEEIEMSLVNNESPIDSILKKYWKNILVLGTALLLIIGGILYYSLCLHKEKYEIVFNNTKNDAYSMEIKKCEVDGETVAQKEDKWIYKVKKSEKEHDWCKIEYTVEFTDNDTTKNKYFGEKFKNQKAETNRTLSRNQPIQINVTPDNTERYCKAILPLWKKLQTVDVTYGDVKKIDKMFTIIDNDNECKSEVYIKMYNVKKIKGSTGNDDNYLETVKQMIGRMKMFFDRCADTTLTAENLIRLFGNYESYITEEQKKGINKMTNSNDTAFKIYMNILYYDNNDGKIKLDNEKKLSQIFELYTQEQN